MRVDFHNSHIVTTRFKDYYFASASRNLRQGNECSLFMRFVGSLMVRRGFKVLNVLYRCVIQNKLRVVSEQLLILAYCKID